MKVGVLIVFVLISIQSFSQNTFQFSLTLDPVSINGLPGLHSYAFGQSDSLLIAIGGRRDGLHARQPFNAFPAAENNDSIYVIDLKNQQFWSRSLSEFSTGIQEQFQSSNMNFHQLGDTLYLIGGYAYSVTEADHITFPNLSTVQLSDLAQAIILDLPISPFVKQISDDRFAVTGGQIGFTNDEFILVGGHRFDGRYNPMGGPSYTQTYTNELRSFKVDNSGSQLSYSDYQVVNDPVHLHRRDFNLLPVVFSEGISGYVISSGVFQTAADLPFLYPVEIHQDGIAPVTSFSQYLSNYHSAKVSLFDSILGSNHMLFFGGMSQYYYKDGELIQDDQVPFVNTISRVTRTPNGNYFEYKLPVEMPGLKGASAEFIPNSDLQYSESGVLLLNRIEADSFLIGYIFGGIYSSDLNPFSSNQTELTQADATIYEVWCVADDQPNEIPIIPVSQCEFELFPNPAKNKFNVRYIFNGPAPTRFAISTVNGQIVQEGLMLNETEGLNTAEIKLDRSISEEVLLITLIFDERNYCTQKLIRFQE